MAAVTHREFHFVNGTVLTIRGDAVIIDSTKTHLKLTTKNGIYYVGLAHLLYQKLILIEELEE